MKIGIPSTIRVDYRDRNMRSVILSFAVQTPGHALTLRSTYFVPAGRRAIIDDISFSSAVFDIPISAGIAQTIMEVTPHGEGSRLVDTLYLNPLSNMGTAHLLSNPHHILDAGDQISLFTVDTGAGGLIEFAGSILISEYDA